MNELVDPFRNINLDDTEFACLKTIVFFDPNARGLTDTARIKRLRHQVQVIAQYNISLHELLCELLL